MKNHMRKLCEAQAEGLVHLVAEDNIDPTDLMHSVLVEIFEGYGGGPYPIGSFVRVNQSWSGSDLTGNNVSLSKGDVVSVLLPNLGEQGYDKLVLLDDGVTRVVVPLKVLGDSIIEQDDDDEWNQQKKKQQQKKQQEQDDEDELNQQKKRQQQKKQQEQADDDDDEETQQKKKQQEQDDDDENSNKEFWAQQKKKQQQQQKKQQEQAADDDEEQKKKQQQKKQQQEQENGDPRKIGPKDFMAPKATGSADTKSGKFVGDGDKPEDPPQPKGASQASSVPVSFIGSGKPKDDPSAQPEPATTPTTVSGQTVEDVLVHLETLLSENEDDAGTYRTISLIQRHLIRENSKRLYKRVHEMIFGSEPYTVDEIYRRLREQDDDDEEKKKQQQKKQQEQAADDDDEEKKKQQQKKQQQS